MKDSDYWKQFTSTGEVEDYLAYKQHCTGKEAEHADDDSRAGTARDKDG